MTDIELMHQLGMAPLRRAMPVRLMRAYEWLAPAPADLAQHIKKSPFYFQVGEMLVIASQTAAQLDLVQREYQLAERAVSELTQVPTRPANTGLRAQFSLPEVVFGDTYAVLQEKGTKLSYMAYRNGIYLRLAQKLTAVMPELLRSLGATSPLPANGDFSSLSQAESTAVARPIGQDLGHLSLMGQQMADHGILGLEIDLPLICGQISDALALVRDTIWALLGAEVAPTDLMALRQQVLGNASVTAPLLTQAPDATPLPGAGDALVTATLACGGNLSAIDLLAGTAWLQSGNQRGLMVAGQPALNTAAAVQLNHDRALRLQTMAAAGLPVPLGGHYPDVESALQDWTHGLADKAIVLKARHRGQGETQAFLVPPTPDDFRAAATKISGELLIESFKKGDLYRLLVLDGQVIAVLALTYANIVGDGRRTISALLAARRTRTQQALPLDEAMQAALAQQGVSADQVLARGTQAFLGTTSAMLRAGDHRNGREELDVSYDDLACRAVAACGLRYATVDLAVVNSYVPYDADEPNQATVVGIQAAPDLAAFTQPSWGDPQPVADKILRAMLQK